ncbi:MAG: acyltransferase family protein [Nitrospirota bacterium]
MEKSKRFYEIDLLRFVAALAVLMYHYTFLGFAAGDMPVKYAAFAPVSRYGFLGVNLFFIISGFVILNSAWNKSAKSFLISRVVRLYPVFWVSCSLTFLLLVIIGGARLESSLKVYLINLTMLNKLLGVRSIDSVYWSLFYEIRFYFFIFLLLIFGKIDKIKIFLGLWLAASYLFFAIAQKDLRYFGYFLMYNYSAYFIAGAVFFLIVSEGVDFYKLFLLFGSYLFSLFTVNEYLGYLTTRFKAHFSIYTASACITVFFLIFYLISTNRTKWISYRKFAILGLLTYPIYLLHQNIGFTLFNVSHSFLNKYALLPLIVLLVFLLSYLVHFRVEKVYSGPFRKILERFFALIESYILVTKKRFFEADGGRDQKEI